MDGRSDTRGAGPRRFAVGWMLAALFGCGDVDAPPGEPELAVEDDGDDELSFQGTQVHLPEDGEEAFPHSADVTDVVAFWRDLPEGVASRTTLHLVLQSHVDEPRTVVPSISLSGLDDRSTRFDLAAVELAPHASVEVPVHLAELPIQGVTHSVHLLASATFHRDEDDRSVALHADPLAFHFAEGYDESFVYTLDTMVTELDGGRISGSVPELRGRVVEGDRFVAIDRGAIIDAEATAEFADVPGVAGIEYSHELTPADALAGTSTPGLAAAPDGDAAPDPGPGPAPDPGIDPGLTCAFFPWSCCTGTNCMDVCADWQTDYVDASNFGEAQREDYGLGLGTQTVDASYAEFSVTKWTCSGNLCFLATVASGLLGPSGCAKLNLVPGTYTLKLKTRMQHGVGGNVYPVEYYPQNDPNANTGYVMLSKSFTAPLVGSPLPPPMVTMPLHPAANAAAAISRMLRSGATVGQPSGFTTHAGLGCGAQPGIPATDACAGSSVKTGPYTNPDNSAGDLRWKFILAHEAGHVVQSKAMGMPFHPYCFTPDNQITQNCEEPNLADPAFAPASCACDHVSGSNGLHCLQSLEWSSAAQIEGFAQFFSARVWSDADSSCWFSYYKQFRTDNAVVVQPPYEVSCSAFANWRDNHCFEDQGGVEYDWLQFLWNTHAVGSSKLSIAEIFDVYKGACSGAWCEGDDVSWSSLAASAAAKFGNGSAKHLKWVNTADSAGVDATEF